MSRPEELRLLVKVASLYHEHGLKQSEIAAQLFVSQATVSRLLKRAQTEGIIRTSVNTPSGTYPLLEERLKRHYGLKDVIVVDGARTNNELLRNLGDAAAFYLESTIRHGEVIGVSSWSETLLAMANAMHPAAHLAGVRVVQILGGVGDPAAASHAAQLTGRLARLLDGEVTPLPAPGIVGSGQTREVLLADPYVNAAVVRFDEVTLALVGIGSIDPSPVLARSGNAFSEEGLAQLRRAGAVGDICLRFFDGDGNPVVSPLNDRVIGMDLDALQRVRRCVGIAGGSRKTAAIRGAARGGLINVLITDEPTATVLLEDEPVS